VYRADLGKFNLDSDPNKTNPLYHQSYAELCKEGPVIELMDMPTKDLASTTRRELLAPRCPNTMVPENPEIYPLSSINTVSLSADPEKPSLLFSGGQSGLGRIHHLSMLDR
jgi:hypothetical protein